MDTVLDRPYITRQQPGGPVPMCLDVFIPKSQTNCPTLVFAHGGGFRKGGRKGDGVERLAQVFTQMGFAFVPVSYRLNTPTEAFSQMDQERIAENIKKGRKAGLTLSEKLSGPAAMAATEDVSAAIGYLRENGTDLGIASNQIGFLGVSAGGIAGISLAYPPAGWESRINAPDRVIAVGGAAIHPWQLIANGPPVLMFHGSKDRIIGVTNARIANRAARAVSAPFELVINPGTGHLDQMDYVMSGKDATGRPVFEKLTKFLEPLQTAR